MSLCYESEKWLMITFASVAITMTVGLVTLAYGQTDTRQQQRESLQALLDYCFQHADRPNPLQDLIDKGFLSKTFTGETCISVRQMYDVLEEEIARETVQIKELNKTRLAELETERQEKEERNSQYLECARNQTTTHLECARIKEGIK